MHVCVAMETKLCRTYTGKVSNTSDVIGKVKTVSRWSKSATGGGLTWSVVMVRAPQISRSHSGPVSPLLLSTATREQGDSPELGTSTVLNIASTYLAYHT